MSIKPQTKINGSHKQECMTFALYYCGVCMKKRFLYFLPNAPNVNPPMNELKHLLYKTIFNKTIYKRVFLSFQPAVGNEVWAQRSFTPLSSFLKNGKVSFENIYKFSFYYIFESNSPYTLKLLKLGLKFLLGSVLTFYPPPPRKKKHNKKQL